MNHPTIAAVFAPTNMLGAAIIAFIYIILSSLAKEPQRQKISAIIVAGAGAAYLSNGLGVWELVFCTIMTIIAYQGLKHYYWIGIAWLLHTCWDVVHHLYGTPIVPFSDTSSAGCAICDTIIALWFFAKAPSFFTWFRKPGLKA